MTMKRNDGDLPAPLEGLAEERVTRARAIKLAGAMMGTGAFTLFTGGTAEARPNRRRRRRRRRIRRRRQAAVTSPQPVVNVGGTTVGGTPVSTTIPITNEGNTPVTIDPTVVGDRFTLGDLSGTDLTIQPGDTLDIPVIFTPQVGDVAGDVSTGELQVRDAADGLLLETVDLTGNVTAPVNP